MCSARPVVMYGTDESKLKEWSDKNQHRFFVTEKYNQRTKELYGLTGSEAEKRRIPADFTELETITVKPLRTLDIFARAGGLSKGLEESNAVQVCGG